MFNAKSCDFFAGSPAVNAKFWSNNLNPLVSVKNVHTVMDGITIGKVTFLSTCQEVAEKVYQVRNGKKIVKERSYLPGYVLVEAALVGEVAHHLRNTPNVIGFLGGSENPVPLRQSEVNRILGTVDELQDAGEELNIPYVVGETVKVNYGPFSGFSGIIEEVNTEKKKLKVMVKIFGRKTPLELGFMQVEKE